MGPRHWFEGVESTQSLAVAHARSGGPIGDWFVAGRQSAGHGRGGRRWESPLGGLYLSMVVPDPPERRTLLPIAVAGRTAAAVSDRYSAPVRLKWPNDLLVVAPDAPPRKLGGVLVDRIRTPTGVAAVIGVGLNVTTDLLELPIALRPHTARLSEFQDPHPSIEEVEALVVDAIGEALRSLRSATASRALLEGCRARLYGLGLDVLVDGVPAGIARALGEDGALWVEERDACRPLRTGELTVSEGT